MSAPRSRGTSARRRRVYVHCMFFVNTASCSNGCCVGGMQDPFDPHDTEASLKACLSFLRCSPCFLFDLCGFDLAIRRKAPRLIMSWEPQPRRHGRSRRLWKCSPSAPVKQTLSANCSRRSCLAVRVLVFISFFKPMLYHTFSVFQSPASSPCSSKFSPRPPLNYYNKSASPPSQTVLRMQSPCTSRVAATRSALSMGTTSLEAPWPLTLRFPASSLLCRYSNCSLFCFACIGSCVFCGCL
jgi:hypothetical protein